MNIASLGMGLAYTALGALLLFMVLKTRHHWGIKALLVVAVSAFYVINFQSVQAMLGWPIKSSLPENFRLISSQVYEPNKLTSSKGKIYLWIAPTTERAGLTRPRGFELPYDSDMHSKLVKAKRQMQSGIPQLGQLTNLDISSQQKALGEAAQNVEFYDMPASALPDK